MHVHQVLVGATPGDAITAAATAIADLLEPIVPTSTWAHLLDPRCRPAIKHLSAMPSPRTDDIIIYHSSIGEPLVADVVLRHPGRLVINYHNITPPRFFAESDPVFARRLAAGRSELRALLGRAELVLVDSTYNAEEVRSYADVPVIVTPPPIDVSALAGLEPHAPTMHHFEVVVDVPVLLHVGQLLPHKRPDLLIAAMHVLTVDLKVPAALVLAGPHRDRDFAWAVQRYIEDLGLTNVSLVGERTKAELAAHYRSATAFVTTSAHEGFCVPVLEAFTFSLPVVARRVAALPETVGEGGILLPPDGGPVLLAEVLAHLLADTRLASSLVEGGRRQLDRFSVQRSRHKMLEALGTVLVA